MEKYIYDGIDNVHYMIEQEHCLHCCNCVEICPVGAIERRQYIE